MDERSVRQILLARYYLHLGTEQLSSTSEAARFAAINLYHEALETTLISCADYVNAKVPDRSTIELYLDRIDQKLDGQLPFRTRILQFNKARVAAKHHLTLPDDSFLNIMKTVIPEFVQTAVRLVFGIDIEDVSLVDLIEDTEIASYLREAQRHLAAGQFYESLTASRKAFYVQFEKQCDIAKFSDPKEAEARGIFSAFFSCEAPHHTKNPKYIADSVNKPSDYIILDHAKLDSELLKEGIDVQTFWNIWRLTPETYQHPDGEWSVEYEFDLADDPQIKQSSTYVLDNLISITLQRQARRKRSRSKSGAFRYIQTMPSANFYKKATRTSEVLGILPDGVRRVNINRAVPALDGTAFYWEASYMAKGGPWLFGYIHTDDTEGEPQFGFIADGTDIKNALPGALPSDSEGETTVEVADDV